MLSCLILSVMLTHKKHTHTASVSVAGHLPKIPSDQQPPLLAMLIMPVCKSLTPVSASPDSRAVSVTSSLLYRLC